jgi:hypothetical protein
MAGARVVAGKGRKERVSVDVEQHFYSWRRGGWCWDPGVGDRWPSVSGSSGDSVTRWGARVPLLWVADMWGHDRVSTSRVGIVAMGCTVHPGQPTYST